MQKGKFYSRLGIISFMLVFFLFNMSANKVENCLSYEYSKGKKEVDFILIDNMKIFGKLERPPVAFLHDKHTDTLLKHGRSCTLCHMADEDNLSLNFQRLVDVDRKTTMQIYHTNCIGCHKDMANLKEKAGPVICGECHVNDHKKSMSSQWVMIKFDKYLHNTHLEANDNKCELCHHEYDDKKQTLFYKKGHENPCSYCHFEKIFDKALPMRDVSHKSCIGCHTDYKSKNMKHGPFECVGCHDASVHSSFKKPENIPRIDRGQPDSVVIKNKVVKKDLINSSTSITQIVPFDHKTHEHYNNTCIICHHSSLESCSKCHVDNDHEGNHVNLYDAMHSLNGRSSCIGCHRSVQTEKECIGCHFRDISNKDRSYSDRFCSSCHEANDLIKLVNCEDKVKTQYLAEYLLKERSSNKLKLYDKKNIPDTININSLENEYEPVVFPHRKIVLSLFDKINDSKLATYFHSDQGVLCLSCHHNTPVTNKPPACSSCHGDKNTNDVSKPFRPELVNAYHQQCIQCHDAMGLEKPNSRNCTACHKKKETVINKK